MGRDMDAEQRIAQLRHRIGEEELAIHFTTSRGPGGQNVNKVSTRAVLTFDVHRSESLSPHEKRLIGERLAGRISRGGVLRVASMRFRTQHANRQAAVDRFFDLLAAALHVPKKRVPSKVTKTAKARRLIEKRRSSERKQLRRAVRGHAES